METVSSTNIHKQANFPHELSRNGTSLRWINPRFIIQGCLWWIARTLPMMRDWGWKAWEFYEVTTDYPLFNFASRRAGRLSGRRTWVAQRNSSRHQGTQHKPIRHFLSALSVATRVLLNQQLSDHVATNERALIMNLWACKLPLFKTQFKYLMLIVLFVYLCMVMRTWWIIMQFSGVRAARQVDAMIAAP